MPVNPARRNKKIIRGKWRVVVWHHGRPKSWIVDGRRKDALLYEAKMRAELEVANPSVIRAAPTFSSFCLTEYQVHARASLGQKTWTNRRYQIATLVDAFGDKRITEIRMRHVEAFKRDRRKEVSAATVNDELKVMRAILQMAKDLEFPCHIPKMPQLRVTERRVRAWTREQVAALYKAVKEESPHMLGLVTFLANTGCRRGEAIALRRENVDVTRGLIGIRPTERDANDQWAPKNQKPREIPVADCLVSYLEGDSKFVFERQRGGPYKAWPQRQFDRARKAAGLKGGPHTLRHTYASHFLSEQPDIYLLSQILGHSYQRTTALYAHLLPDYLERARNAVSLPPPLQLVTD